MKAIKIISIFLGTTSFMFGVLKFINPFKGWVESQIEQSGLPQIALPLVITGEIITGLLFLFPFIFKNKFSKYKFSLIATANVILIVMMIVAIYVHLLPNVQAAVLPMKIKAPYIPLFNVLLAVINLILIRKYRKV